MKKNIFNNKGFTLAELLIYMGILTILLYILTDIFASILETKMQSDATSRVKQEGQYILTKLTHDLSQANSITTPPLGSQSDTLSISINSIDYTYSLVNNNLLLITNSASDVLNSYDVKLSDLNFIHYGNVGGKTMIKTTFTVYSTTTTNTGLVSENYGSLIGTR